VVIGDILDLGKLVIVRQDNGMALFLQAGDLLAEIGKYCLGHI
jgi:hypothetical protein